MTPVILESPYAAPTRAERARLKRYLHHAMRDALLQHGEAPFASHRLYTGRGILDDTIPDERALGIEAGLLWGRFARRTVVYTDLGVSPGMIKGIDRAHDEGRPVEMRSLEAWRDGRQPPMDVGDIDEPTFSHLLAEANTKAIELELAKSKHRQLREMWHALEPEQRSQLFDRIFV